MSGYTPLFNSVLDGTLYGKWPHTGIWMCLLSQCDRNGNIDMVPGLLAAKIGVPEQTLLECIHDFMQPDPGSRTGDLEGRRLELMCPDASREWGWRVVNHSLYRERARKQAYDSKRTASGKDAERKQQLRGSREVPTRPAKSRSQTQTQTHTQTQTRVGKEGMQGETRAMRSTASRLPDDWNLTQERRRIAETEGADATRTFANFTDYWKSAGGQKARKHDWDAAWRIWCRREGDTRKTATAVRKTRYEEITGPLEDKINGTSQLCDQNALRLIK